MIAVSSRQPTGRHPEPYQRIQAMNTYHISFSLCSTGPEIFHETTITAETTDAAKAALLEKYGWQEVTFCNVNPIETVQAMQAAAAVGRREKEASYAAALEAIQPIFDAEVAAKGLTGPTKAGSRRKLRARLIKDLLSANAR